MRNFFDMAISELYKAGKVKEDQLGVLAKAVICAKLGSCSTRGQEVAFGHHILQLADSLRQTTPTTDKNVAEMGQNTQTQKPAAKSTDQRPMKPQQRSVQINVQKATKTLPLFPFEDKTQLRQSTQQRAQPAQTPNGHALKNTGVIEQSRLDRLAELVTKEVKADVAVVRAVLSSIMSYLSAYPSVGILRLIDDIAKKTKADPRVVKAAIDVLRGADIIEVVDGAVVNLKKR